MLQQCCATFLHSRHSKYCRRVMAAHQPHVAYCGGGGGDGCVTFQFHLVDLVCPTIIKNMKTEREQKTRKTIIYLIMIIIIMRGENFVAHRCTAEHQLRITVLQPTLGKQGQVWLIYTKSDFRFLHMQAYVNFESSDYEYIIFNRSVVCFNAKAAKRISIKFRFGYLHHSVRV
jgi:hypothetical protein